MVISCFNVLPTESKSLTHFKIFRTVFLLTVLFLAGCDDDGQGKDSAGATASESGIAAVDLASSTDKAKTPGPTVALVMKTLLNPFFVAMKEGAEAAARDHEVRLLVRTAATETSYAKQVGILDALIDTGVDAVVISPADSVQVIPALKRVQQAGIVLINIDNPLDRAAAQAYDLEPVPLITVDNERGAYLAAAHIAAQVPDGERAQAAILEGLPGIDTTLTRRRGATRAFADVPRVTLVASETANFEITQAHAVTLSLLDRFPNLRLLFASNDMMAIGAVRALKDTHRTGVLVAGFDALEEAKDAIRRGDLEVTVDQQAHRQGYLGVSYAVRRLAGEALPDRTIVDILLVHAGTLAD